MWSGGCVDQQHTRAVYHWHPQVVRALPQLLPTVQALLLDAISIALFNKPFTAERPPAAVQLLSQAVAGGEHQGSALIKVSLRTLSAIDFDSVPLLPFVYSITEFLDYADPSVRKVVCCGIRVLWYPCVATCTAALACVAGGCIHRPLRHRAKV